MNVNHFSELSSRLIVPPNLTSFTQSATNTIPDALAPELIVNAWLEIVITAAATVRMPSITAVAEWLGPDRRFGTNFWLMMTNKAATNLTLTLQPSADTHFTLPAAATSSALGQNEALWWLCSYDDAAGTVVSREWSKG